MGLRELIFKRVVTSAIAIAGVLLLVFSLLHVIPGDPVDNLLGEQATPEDRAAMKKCLGTDLPMTKQLTRFVGSITDGTLGKICPSERTTVWSLIRRNLPHTAALAFSAMLIALLCAIPLGIFAALRRGTWIDAMTMGISLAGISIPYMVLGPVLILVFYVRLGWLPGPADPLSASGSLVLPSIALALHLVAMLSRMTRATMLDVVREDYLRTARAKGLPEHLVIFKHGLKNALVPIITVAGIQFGGLLSGALVVEKIFARPGIGTLLINAISSRNYPVIQGCVLVISVSYVLVNLFVDIAYGLADPRIRVSK